MEAAVDSFIEKNASHVTLAARSDTIVGITRFATSHPSRRIAFVTSGGTNVPLEQSGVRYISNFSSGGRGSAMTECFLDQQYAVVLLAKKGSLLPFDRHFQRQTFSMGSFDITEGGEVKAKPESNVAMVDVVRAYQSAKDRLHVMTFETVGEYMLLLKLCCVALRDAVAPDAARLTVILAAAVSDFYVPWDAMPQHKIQSRAHDGIDIHLENVPKALGCVSGVWARGAFIVGFKLESDEAILQTKALESMASYFLHATVANMITNYNERVVVYAAEGAKMVVERKAPKEIEGELVQTLASLHDKHRGK